jgi:TP53 regulating kinase-like protein
MVDAAEGVLGIEWIEGINVRMLLGGGVEGEEERVSDPEEFYDDASLSHVDPLEEYQVTMGMFLIPNLPSLFTLTCVGEIMGLIGSEIAKMHQVDIIHGDLTTSNMIIRHPFAPKGPSSTKLVCGMFTRRFLLVNGR